MDHRLQILLRKNPLLSFQLCSVKADELGVLEPFQGKIKSDTEVIFIEGVHESSDDIRAFLERGGEVVFVENDLSMIQFFIQESNLIEHDLVEVVSSSDEELKKIAWKYLYRKKEIMGHLPLLKRWIDGVHMVASDLMQSRKVVRNLQANILRSHEFINGNGLKGVYRGKTAIVCGSGPSLNEEALNQIRQVEGFALVIAAGSGMLKLERAGVRIDYGVYVDPEPELEPYRKMASFDFPLFYQNRMCENLFSLHKGKKIWMGASDGWKLDDELMRVAGIEPWQIDSGWNAGTFALSIAAFLGCTKIVFIGLDNGMPNNRELCEGEFLLDGLITRRDLAGGRDWIEEFVKERSEIEFLMPKQGLFIDGVKRDNHWISSIHLIPLVSPQFSQEELNFSRLAQFIGEINSSALEEALESFLDSLREGVDSLGFEREKVLLEVELEESLLYGYVIKSLWEVMAPLFYREEETNPDDVKKFIAKATFVLSTLKEVKCPDTFLLTELSQGICFCGMLEGEVRRNTASGTVCEVEHYRRGRRHGKWVSLFENGDLKGEVHYKEGVLHGSFILWGDRGIKREGRYWLGKRDGRHRLYDRNGGLLCEMVYDKGLPISEHVTYNSYGMLIEKVVYQTEKKFDRYCFNDQGKPIYSGVFKGDQFEETHFDLAGKMIQVRKGQWMEEKLVWD